ncbi:helix-turn-helix transcriptional regulator [Denitrobacterium detoxificans]|uniref:helix-turn-helix transcriptional regulator n=1 Tax=Denitrobacterium detoxificans TaxID=79604 RepID=UPI0026F20861|nr:helix-turn-helix transcriptional regulator [Denitrobacterium detoxificans]
MEIAWYIYAILLLGVTGVACVAAISVWMLTRRRDCLVAAVGFFAYALDTTIIFFDEYIRVKPVGDEFVVGVLIHPLLQVPLSALLVLCVWYWVLARCHVRVSQLVAIGASAGVLVVLCLVAPVEGFADRVRSMLYWGLRDLGVIGALVYAFWWYRHRANAAIRADMAGHRVVFGACVSLAALMLAEDVGNILLTGADGVFGLVGGMAWHLTERNVSENVMIVCCAVWFVAYARRLMSVFSHRPALPADERLSHAMSDAFESKLLVFVDEHGLSTRELEVLRLVLNGNDAQNIASKLVISVGTVKSHLHRIYKKTGVSGRDELIGVFWRA